MVVLHREPVAPQGARDSLARVARAGIDDRASFRNGAQPLDEDAKPVLVPCNLLHVVAEIRTNDARSHHGHLAAEGVRDAGRGRRGGGGRHAEHGWFAERLKRPPDEEVVRAEIVAPHADAMHLVDHHKADADRAQGLDEGGAPESFGCRIEETSPPVRHRVEAPCRLVGFERGVDERRGGTDLCRELVDLILHQRDQRGQNERGLGRSIAASW